jgi:hypothetical protein
MTLYEFRALNDIDQANAVWDNGTHLGTRVEEGQSVLLYNVCDFYVEVFYSNGLNEITQLKAFKTTKLLEPYL